MIGAENKNAAAHAGFEGLEEPPSTFVFMGSFASVPCGSHGLDAATARSQFTSLGTCLARFQRLMVRRA